MNENIDLTSILQGCPVGTKFYSTIHDEISFKGIELSSDYPIIFYLDAVGGVTTVTEKGMALRGVGECIVFPSKDQRDWSKFERFWDKPKKKERFDPNTLQPFDRVLIRNGNFWTTDFFSYIAGQWVNCVGGGGVECVPYNEETKNLIGTSEDCPDYYKWWEEK